MTSRRATASLQQPIEVPLPERQQPRLVHFLEFFGRMAIANLDSVIARMPVDKFDGLQARPKENIRLVASLVSQRAAPHGTRPNQQIHDRRNHSAFLQELPNRRLLVSLSKGLEHRVARHIDSNDGAASLSTHQVDW